jgi:hypothetical protein
VLDELTAREMDVRLVAKLRDKGEYDRVKHGALRDEPLTPAERLELRNKLALTTASAVHGRHRRQRQDYASHP